LDDALKQYTAESKATEQSSFYADSQSGGIKQAWRCFRVTRMTTVLPDRPGDAVTRTIDFDFLGQVQVVGADDRVDHLGAKLENAYGIKVRPLRVYMARPVAKGSRIGISANLSLDAVWRDGSEGKRATIFSTGLMDRKFVRQSNGWMPGGTFYYFPFQGPQGNEDPTNFPSWAGLPLQPMVPISSAGTGGTVVTVTATFTEVGDGDGKGFIKAVDTLFGKSQSDLTTAATKAAKKLVDPDPPTPAAKPDQFCGTFTNTGNGGTIQWTKSDAACPG
jgi:hypothetical protein